VIHYEQPVEYQCICSCCCPPFAREPKQKALTAYIVSRVVIVVIIGARVSLDRGERVGVTIVRDESSDLVNHDAIADGVAHVVAERS